MRLGIGLAIVVLVAGCGNGLPSTSVAPSAATIVPPASAARTPSSDAASPSGPSPASVRVDERLLGRLPAAVDGIRAQSDPETARVVAGDAELQAQIQAISIAIYIAPEASGSAGDYAVATVVQLRPGVFSEIFYRDWRDTFDVGVCEQAGGVSTRAETTIAERRVFIGTCAGGVRTYHVRLADDDLLVSIQGVGEQRLGERIVEGLTE